MPLQILQKGPTALQGALLGLGQGLQELASNKLAQMRQANEQAQFAQSLRNANFEPGVANVIASLPMEQRLKALQPFLGDTRFNTPQQQQAAVQPVIPEAVIQEPTIHAAATKQQFNQLSGQKPELPSAFDMGQEVRRTALGFPETFSPDSVKDLIKTFEGFGQKFSPEQRAHIEQQATEISRNPENMAALQQQYDQAVKNNEQIELRRPGFTGQAVPLQQLQQPGQPLYRQPVKPLTEMEKIAQERLEVAKRKEERAERGEAFKLTKEERKEIVTKAKAARQNLRDLDRLEELEKEGKLDTPGYIEMLKRSGFDIPALMNPGSEEYQKVAQTFIRDAKTYLGSRISNFELEQFLKTIPSLSQSPEGRKRVIGNLKYINNVSLAYNDALKDVIAENKGVPPLDLEERIDDKIEKKLDGIANKFRKDISKNVPPAQNKLVTALQASLGGAASAIPGALKGAAKGAIVGSVVPGLGTGAGAVLGALGGGTGIL